MLYTQIKEDMVKALKSREEIRLTILRGVISSITNELVSQKRKPSEILDDDGVITVIKRAVKQRKDSIEQFTKGGREELANKEREELAILEEYLPAQLSRDEINSVVDKIITNLGGEVDKSKIGIVIGTVMKELDGNVDGSIVKEIIEEKLN